MDHFAILDVPIAEVGDIVHGICYAHCKIKLNEKPGMFEDANNVEGFKRGVAGIHRITITSVRTKAFNLLIKTYEADEVYICEWFCDYWWGKWGGWVLGALPPGKPSTQNSPEACNRWSKHSFCNGKQLLLAPFHQHALKFVREDTIYDREFPVPTGPIARATTYG
ncbi:hypothetical protein CYMTET_6564 [Cymbomonas tetramitiformis]|uniref:Uncharacterized protein n=1 Tax=Cymbomonas tetramitiformis TaxID=36881 RepID=A0AAE0GX69_9CHLO|nr:hypothetical protein CYMTET_6564 [Cymbomonas tetramitiformis]